MRTLRSSAPLLVMLLALTAALVALHRLGSAPWAALPPVGSLGPWLADTPPQDAVMALVRLLALMLGWWVLASTVAYALAAAARAERGRLALAAITPVGVRRLADQAVALTLATGIVLGAGAPAHAAPLPPSHGGPEVVEDVQRAPLHGSIDADLEPPAEHVTGDPIGDPAPGRPVEGSDDPDVAEHDGQRPDAGDEGTDERDDDEGTDEDEHEDERDEDRRDEDEREDGRDEDDDAQPSEADVVTVAPGDHLWGLAAAHVAASEGRAVQDLAPDEIVDAWREVVETNRGHLRSGDPDLIHPGEDITLPSLD